MKWNKKGLIFKPDEKKEWMTSHASVPFALKIGEDEYRIYFSSRDSQNRSSIGYLEINIDNPKKINFLTETPVLKPGELGTFDDSGAMESCLVDNEGKKYLYYVGWNKGGTVRYHTSVGLAISSDGGKSFKKFSDGPILERDVFEPHFCSNPYVVYDDELWKMWYISFVKWQIRKNEPFPYYHIKYAESKDGIFWKREGVICIDFKDENEWAISRPCVLREEGIYNMWYSFRGKNNYRIGYAESKDGISWSRCDEDVGIDVSYSGWDSEMIEYPFVFEHKEKKYMLYCGNGFGKTGFGYAVLEK